MLVFRIRYEDKIGEFPVDYKQAAEFVRVFVRVSEFLLLFKEPALNEFINIGGVIIPGGSRLRRVDKQLTDWLLFLANREYWVRGKSPFPDLVRCLLDKIRDLYKVLGDRAEIFAA